ncbi:MAG: homoserine O-succinyltransferase, partial [Bradyrhizobium guangdongense]
MALLFDKRQSIESPALAPGLDDLAHGERAELTIGLINNMPDSALKTAERQFMRLLNGARGHARIRFHCFSLPSVSRSPTAQAHVDNEYSDIAE